MFVSLCTIKADSIIFCNNLEWMLSHSYILYLLIFSGNLIFVIFLSQYLIGFLNKFHVVDYPGGRKNHSEPVPRMGGLLIFIPLLPALFLFYENILHLKYIIYSSGLIVLCGIIDDITGLKWIYKYFIQSIAAAIILFSLYPEFGEISLFGILIPAPLDAVLLFFFITGVINSINMLDGLDGLVTGTALLLFMLVFTSAFISNNSLLMIISASMTGSLLGFLKFNAFPARIFLGDTGSLLIGFLLAVSVLILTDQINSEQLDLGFSIVLLGVPVIDTIKVIFLRLYNRKSPFQPDRSHIHHKISDNKIHHKHTVFLIQLFTVAYIFIALYYGYFNKLQAFALYISLSTILVLFNPLYRLFISIKNHSSRLVLRLYSSRLNIELFRKVFIPSSGLVIILIFLLFFPVKPNVPVEVIMIMITICTLLLLAAFLKLKKYNVFDDMYLLLNLSVFFVLSERGEPHFSSILFNLAMAAIIGFLGIFILFREKIFGRKVSLFSGLDLNMIIIIVFSVLLQIIIHDPSLSFPGQNLFTGFIIYMWYKVVRLIVPGINGRMYLLVFFLPFVTLLETAF